MKEPLVLVVASVLIAGTPASGQQVSKLVASDAAQSGNGIEDQFGASVAISEDTAIAGSPYDDTAWGEDSGSAYVFQKVGGAWVQEAKLLADDGSVGDYFGSSVALSGDLAIVGAPGDAGLWANMGSAYVFERAAGSWTQVAKLTAPDGSNEDNFGCSVSLSGSTALVGAKFHNSPGAAAAAGAVYVFHAVGGVWSLQAELTASDADQDDHFGGSVALSGDTALIGASGDDAKGSDSGSAYVFTRLAGSWTRTAKLTASDGLTSDSFGSAVAISGSVAVVGAYLADNGSFDAGAAYVFEGAGTIWAQGAKLSAPTPTASGWFGQSVAVAGTLAVIGELNNDINGSDAGAAHAFQKIADSWKLSNTLTASDGSPPDHLGFAVAASGSNVLTGTPLDSDISHYAGSSYVFNILLSLGDELAGSSGSPVMIGTGSLLPATTLSLGLKNARPFSPSFLIVGLSLMAAPFKGGTLAPSPNLIFALQTDGFGKGAFGGFWPAGVPSGFTTYFQWWVQDLAGPKGLAASNALAGTAP